MDKSVIVNFVDGVITIGGIPYFFAFDKPDAAFPYDFIVWENSRGFYQGEGGSLHKPFSAEQYDSVVQPYVALWEAEKARLDEIANRPLTLEQTRAAAIERLRLRKWQAKDAGIIVNGIAIDTDDKGQATINGAVTNVLLDPAFTATWKTSAMDEHGQSVWVELDAAMIVGLSKAMTRYTEACFGVEAAKQADIAACGTVAEIGAWLDASLDAGWPDRIITMGE